MLPLGSLFESYEPVDDVANVVDLNPHDVVKVVVDTGVDGAEQPHYVRRRYMLSKRRNSNFEITNHRE